MGFLHESVPLSWEQAVDRRVLQYVREHGIDQFIHVFQACRDIRGDPFRWGDEVEHQILRIVGGTEGAERSVKISLRSPEVLAELRAAEIAHATSKGADTCTWVPEYGRWMLESTPGQPYTGINGIVDVQRSLRTRRARLVSALQPGEVAPSVTSCPLFGVGDFCDPPAQPNGAVMQSLFVPDEAIFPHVRFPTLTRSIRERRGSKVEIRRPKMIDTRTAKATHGCVDFVPTSVEEADSMGHVYADAMAFGMGSSCLQVTFQASDISESRHLYDQLAAFTPLLLALTAATPFLRGWICDDDVRWGQIAQSVDDRTVAERSTAQTELAGDARLAGSGVKPIRKSRYDAIDCYIGQQSASYNDVPFIADQEYVDRLLKGGVDEVLAQHVAHLFARDPLVTFGDRIEIDDQRETDHWENLQSTNWQSLRWKPPPPAKGCLEVSAADHIGWRVEFRSMEVQMTDFENAAFIAFVVLLSRVIVEFQLDLRIPMSKLEENMQTAQRREACTQERFWFRTEFHNTDALSPWCMMTIKEIFRGTSDFPGLLTYCQKYLDTSSCSEWRFTMQSYLDFIMQRADGTLLTTATWMRKFVLSHAAYAHDSRVPAAAAHDLMVAAAEIGEGLRLCPEVMGNSPAQFYNESSGSTADSTELRAETSCIRSGSSSSPSSSRSSCSALRCASDVDACPVVATKCDDEVLRAHASQSTC